MGPGGSGSEGWKHRRGGGGCEGGCALPTGGLGCGSLAPDPRGGGSRLCAESWGSAGSWPCCWEAMAAATARHSSRARGVLKVKVPSPESLRRPASKEKTFCGIRGHGEGLEAAGGGTQGTGRARGTHLILAKFAEVGVGPGEQGLPRLRVLQRQALGQGGQQVVPVEAAASGRVRAQHQHREISHWGSRTRLGSAPLRPP